MAPIADFISRVTAIHSTGNGTEHSYRSAFETLFVALDPEISALNEPKCIRCIAPDFIVPGDNTVTGNVEAKKNQRQC